MNAQDRKMLEQINSNWLMGSVFFISITLVLGYFFAKEVFSGNSIDVDYALKLGLPFVLGIVVSWFLVRRYQQSKEELKKE